MIDCNFSIRLNYGQFFLATYIGNNFWNEWNTFLNTSSTNFILNINESSLIVMDELYCLNYFTVNSDTLVTLIGKKNNSSISRILICYNMDLSNNYYFVEVPFNNLSKYFGYYYNAYQTHATGNYLHKILYFQSNYIKFDYRTRSFTNNTIISDYSLTNIDNLVHFETLENGTIYLDAVNTLQPDQWISLDKIHIVTCTNIFVTCPLDYVLYDNQMTHTIVPGYVTGGIVTGVVIGNNCNLNINVFNTYSPELNIGGTVDNVIEISIDLSNCNFTNCLISYLKFVGNLDEINFTNCVFNDLWETLRYTTSISNINLTNITNDGDSFTASSYNALYLNGSFASLSQKKSERLENKVFVKDPEGNMIDVPYYLMNEDFSNWDLSNKDLSKFEFNNSSFINTNLTNSTLPSKKSLTGANLSQVKINNPKEFILKNKNIKLRHKRNNIYSLSW